MGRAGGYDFAGRTLSLSATLYRKKDRYLPKLAEVAVVSLKGSERVFGRVSLDLSQYVDMLERTFPATPFTLERCADRRARLLLRIHTRWIKGAAGTAGGAEDELSQQGAAAGAEAEADEAHNLDDFIGGAGAAQGARRTTPRTRTTAGRSSSSRSRSDAQPPSRPRRKQRR